VVVDLEHFFFWPLFFVCFFFQWLLVMWQRRDFRFRSPPHYGHVISGRTTSNTFLSLFFFLATDNSFSTNQPDDVLRFVVLLFYFYFVLFYFFFGNCNLRASSRILQCRSSTRFDDVIVPPFGWPVDHLTS